MPYPEEVSCKLVVECNVLAISKRLLRFRRSHNMVVECKVLAPSKRECQAYGYELLRTQPTTVRK